MLAHGMLMAAIGSSSKWRYVRIYITANNGDAYTTIQEIEIATTPGGADITNPSMAVGQSVGNFKGAIDNGLVGTDGTQIWQNINSFPMWGYVDLVTSFDISEIRIQGQNNAATQNSRSPKDFKIQGSNDAISWVDIKTFSGISGWVAGTYKVFALK